MTDDDLLRQFADCSLPKDQWTHLAHVKVAYLHLLRFSAEETIARLRKGIQALNAAHGVVDSPTRGYHETMTQAWIRVIAATLAEFGSADSAEAFLKLQPQLGHSKILQRYYSTERLMSADAKARFVEPDRMPLPSSAAGR